MVSTSFVARRGNELGLGATWNPVKFVVLGLSSVSYRLIFRGRNTDQPQLVFMWVLYPGQIQNLET